MQLEAGKVILSSKQMPNYDSDLRKFIAIVLTLTLVGLTAYQVGNRIAWDGANKKYSIAVRRDDLDRASSIYGETEVGLIEKLEQKGTNLLLFQHNFATDDDPGVPVNLKEYRQTGIRIGLEIRNIQLADRRDFEELIELLNKIEPSYLLLRALEGANIPEDLKNWLARTDVPLGTVEFRDKTLTRSLVKEGISNHLRLHRVFQEEVGTLTSTERVARYVRAIEERNIGVIEYRLPLNSELDQLLADLDSIRAELSDLGYEEVPVGKARGSGGGPGTPRWISLLLIVSASGLGLHLLFLDERIPRTAIAAGLMAIIAGAAVGLSLFPVLTKQAVALAIAVGAPVAGLRLLNDYGLSFREGRFPGATYLDFLGLSIFSSFTGLVVSSLLLEDLFVFKLYQFRGVKVSLFLPLLFLLLAATYLGQFRISQIDFSYSKLLAGGLLLGLFLFLLVRSGNFNFLRSTDLEEAIRRWLDANLLVRPRFKEFLIGHPAMIAWLYLAGRFEKNFQFCKLTLFLLGFIGQISIINTFVHVHTPVTISLIRTANGLAGGMMLGTVLLFLLIGGVHLWNRKTE